MRIIPSKILSALLGMLVILPAFAKLPPQPAVNLHDTLLPSPIKPIGTNGVLITGEANSGSTVRLRVTTSFGVTHETQVPVNQKRFSCRYPSDFPGAPPLSPSLLYIDATDTTHFGGTDMLQHQAEALLIIAGPGPSSLPDLPASFTDDFIDHNGHRDADAVTWPLHRTLVNLFMQSRAARLAGVGRANFNLSHQADFDWFKNHVALYDFDHRDRDWSNPLGHRVARGFWQAVWNTWFNPSNDHPWDGDPSNRAQTNYRPYTFANDFADLLVLQQMRRSLPRQWPDQRDQLAEEALANLLAMQHRTPENFALTNAHGHREHYTAGAFRYGMFETGEWLTEGTGWFVNPAHNDYRAGGVFNGRAVWALGESLKANPTDPHATELRHALALALRFCLHDALPSGYARQHSPNLVFWRDPGEHGYLLLGMLAAAQVDPNLPIALAPNSPPQPLHELCAQTLDALIAEVKRSGTWTPYPDQDAMAIAALATGCSVLNSHPHRERWLLTARRAANDWLQAQAPPSERTNATPHFGFLRGRAMTHFMGDDHHVRFTLYVAGHWLHALAKLHALTAETPYRDRSNQLLRYLCGDNPFHCRLLNELGAVHNYVRDADQDGTEDTLHWDLYPESTAFVQIGLLHWLRQP